MSYYYQAVPLANRMEKAEPVPVKAARKPTKRRRARHPAGTEEGGEFIGDDPATPEDEAWEAEPVA